MYDTFFANLGIEGAISAITIDFKNNVEVIADYETKTIKKLIGGNVVSEFSMLGKSPEWMTGYLSGISEIGNGK
jgi:hypothetical protein